MFISIGKERKTPCEVIFERHYFVCLYSWCNTVKCLRTCGHHVLGRMGLPYFLKYGGSACALLALELRYNSDLVSGFNKSKV